MKLRIRINKQTSRVELEGEEPNLTDLINHIKEILLPAYGLSSDTEVILSLNGSEFLSDSGQTLSACGIVSGDLICVLLPQSAATAMPDSSSSSTNTTTNNSSRDQRQNNGSSDQPGSSSSSSIGCPAAETELDQTCDIPDSDPPPLVWEPMLCSEAEEGQAPLSLELLFHSGEVSSPSDAVMVASHLLMLETGFVPQGSELKLGVMPEGWRSASGLYKLQYTHPLCGGSLTSVVAVCMGRMLVINTTLKVTETVDTSCKLYLDPSSYVTTTSTESAAIAFRDLRKLSRVFKDQLAYPLIAAARAAMSLPVAFGLAALPPELLLRVLRLLDVRSLVRLSSVSRHFNAATDDSTLWRRLYRRDFIDRIPDRPRDTDWKKLYQTAYKTRRDRRFPRHRPLPPVPPLIFPPIIPPVIPPVPGIIGGEYDERPRLPNHPLLRPRFNPIGLPPNPDGRLQYDHRRFRPPAGGRAADIRRGFI